MVETAANEVPDRDADRVAFGEGLRRAREFRGLNVEEVATQLNLNHRVVTALEQGAYGQLPSPAYVRGYIRSYARIVGMDPEPFLQASAYFTEDTPNLRPFSSRPSRTERGGDAVVKLITYGVIGGVLVLLFIRWQHQWQQRVEPDSAIPLETIMIPELEPATETTTEIDGLDLSWETPLSAHDPKDRMVSGGNDKDDLALLELEPTGSEASPGNDDPAADDRPTDQLDRIVLKPGRESWVEITDAGGKNLYYGLTRKEISVQGEPPFNLVIGNAQDVTLQHNGDPVDLSDRAQHGVARLKLGSPLTAPVD